MVKKPVAYHEVRTCQLTVGRLQKGSGGSDQEDRSIPESPTRELDILLANVDSDISSGRWQILEDVACSAADVDDLLVVSTVPCRVGEPLPGPPGASDVLKR